MKNIGIALTGSFCTIDKAIKIYENLKNSGYKMTPVFSFNVYKLDTIFNKAAETKKHIEDITQKKVIHTITGAEPIKSMDFDAFVVLPCTGNTLAKIANGITDTPVTMAVKAHLRNNKPVILGIASNDSLGVNAKNLGILLNTKNIFFVPFKQDNFLSKTNSLVSDFDKTLETIENAIEGKQLQPLLV